MKTTEYISCKILKYQNPPSGIQRRDAIKDYTPQVPFNKMKWINTPIQQPVLSQDNILDLFEKDEEELENIVYLSLIHI